MKCPICNIDLLMSERQGIEIDYCPECRGVWLDRGELDKIIEKSASVDFGQEVVVPTQSYSVNENFDNKHEKHESVDPKTGKKKRREGPLEFLGDIFDFGG